MGNEKLNTTMRSDWSQIPELSKFQPLHTIVAYDDFDRGLCGWIDLKPNHTEADFRAYPGILDKTQFGPSMLSTASFGFAGTHGSMDGLYSLKVATRPVANRYEEPVKPGSLGQAIKRLSVHRPCGLMQFEMWYAYTPEMDRIGIGEQDVRAFGVLFDMVDDQYRYFMGVRYVNAVNGDMTQRWQYMHAGPVSDEAWTYGAQNEWAKTGIDPQWYGRRYADGSTDGFQWVPDGRQQLCYNETDDKINWLYLRFLFDTEKREYVELQSGQKTYDLRGLSPTLVGAYARVRGLLNPSVWIETDTDRRVFLYLDSVVVSVA